MIPTMRSLPAPHALSAHLADRYGLGFTGCTLLRSLVNDVYELTTGDARYVLKLYRHDGRDPDEIRWEAGLWAHLQTAGLQVPPVLLSDGEPVGLLETPEGPRPFIVSGFVEGTKPQPPFDDELYDAFGRQLAAFHDAADNYHSTYARRPAEIADRLHEPLEQILAVDRAEENLLRDLAAAVRNNLAEYSNTGICHGDVSLDNILLTKQGLLLLDFDLTAVGPRAADFAGVATTPYWDAFRTGYTTRRPVTDADLAAIPYLQIVGRIFNLRFHLVDKPLFRGTESRAEGWAADELGALRRAAGELL
ncbi:phosphotransferase [Kribbella sp. NBC_01484]|uniref:phosphotransferase enzyme family protein n=1 Tax=Kribbella sp. NBC_01484 TaxID=2903579 RepID=UPI002E343007|nr:phosphotransferase [Kribbella sp. NBC_01484]